MGLVAHIVGELVPVEETVDEEEERVRRLLAGVPLVRLREAGVLGPLRRIFDGEQT